MGTTGETSPERLLLTAGVQRVPSPKVDLFILRNFLSPEECQALIALIEANHRPSTIADSNGDTAFRTSSTCDLQADEPVVARVVDRICALSSLAAEHGEPLQGQRYEVGQEFKAHTDYFEPDGADFARFCSRSGQRTWTFMAFLNDVPAGGATRFKAIDKIVQPECGKLLFWNNRRPDGSVNPATLHQAMKVRKGMKYVITQWFRERAHQTA
ncbi:MAG TPA: 2OG-Fe(II) oxygenase [Novosphingobium sp.]|nr:2OG-Fe(II) oxygenase [Novosphingobium sp.]